MQDLLRFRICSQTKHDANVSGFAVRKISRIWRVWVWIRIQMHIHVLDAFGLFWSLSISLNLSPSLRCSVFLSVSICLYLSLSLCLFILFFISDIKSGRAIGDHILWSSSYDCHTLNANKDIAICPETQTPQALSSQPTNN